MRYTARAASPEAGNSIRKTAIGGNQVWAGLGMQDRSFQVNVHVLQVVDGSQ